MEELGFGPYPELLQQIQMEYEKCLALNSVIKGQAFQEEEVVKKWGGRGMEKTGKWGKK